MGFSWYEMATDANMTSKAFRIGITRMVTFLLLASSLICKYCLGRKCIASCLKYLGYLAFFVCYWTTFIHYEREGFAISLLSPKGNNLLLCLCIESTIAWLFFRIFSFKRLGTYCNRR